jgi:uncharacterized Rmd1/YagE family protein
MRCIGYCTAESYDAPRLFAYFQSINGSAQLLRDVIHLTSKDEKGIKRDAFCFPFGVTIFWGFTEPEEKEMLGVLKDFEKERFSKPEVDEFSFRYGEKLKVGDDEIILPKKDPLTKLSLSFAIVQSLKLTVFEETILRTVNHSKQIPKDLAGKGKIKLSRSETARKLGEIYQERNYINLHSEILDTPEIFWDHSELEPHYRRMIHYLDVTKRVDLLNRRLALLHELFEILSDRLNQQYTARLELSIVILIVIEVVLTLIRDFHWI